MERGIVSFFFNFKTYYIFCLLFTAKCRGRQEKICDICLHYAIMTLIKLLGKPVFYILFFVKILLYYLLYSSEIFFVTRFKITQWTTATRLFTYSRAPPTLQRFGLFTIYDVFRTPSIWQCREIDNCR